MLFSLEFYWAARMVPSAGALSNPGLETQEKPYEHRESWQWHRDALELARSE
jgi:hypothetical protein